MECNSALDGIFAIDTGYLKPGFASAHLVLSRGEAAFIETGPQSALPRLLAALADHDVPPEAVAWVGVSHVHLDHAGAAGLLLPHLPRARLLVHPKGARHLTDPSRLAEGVRTVYGEERFKTWFGAIQAIDPERIHTPGDGEEIPLGERTFRILHTEGHARHHMVFWDEAHGDLFTGDAFGLSYRALDDDEGRPLLIPATSPSQFDPEPALATFRRLAALQPATLHLTHFGPMEYRPHFPHMLLEQVEAFVALGEKLAGAGENRDFLLREGVLSIIAAAHGRDPERIRPLLEMDLELNASGIAGWLDGRRR